MPIQIMNGDFSGTTTKYYNPFSGISLTTQGHFPIPRAITINTCTISRNEAPGAGESNTVQFVNGTQGSTPTGNDTVLSGASATSASQAVGGSWTASTPEGAVGGAAAQAKHVELAFTHVVAVDEHNIAFSYEDAANNVIGYHGFGAYGYNYGSEVAADQDGFINFGIGSDASTTEAPVQIPWPATGVFQFCAVDYFVGPGSGDVTLVLRKDTGGGAADTGLSFTFSDTNNAKHLALDTTTTVSVTAGDLLSWRFQVATTDNGFGFTVICGFIAT
jgi:hypothetical protein